MPTRNSSFFQTTVCFYQTTFTTVPFFKQHLQQFFFQTTFTTVLFSNNIYNGSFFKQHLQR